MSRKRDKSAVDRAARLYVEEGLTRDEVALALHVSGPTVSRWLADVMRPRGARKRADVPDDLVVELREQTQLSYQQMADETGMSKTGVRLRYGALTGKERPGRHRAPRPEEA